MGVQERRLRAALFWSAHAAECKTEGRTTHSRELGTFGDVVAAAVVCTLRVTTSARLRMAITVRPVCLSTPEDVEIGYVSVCIIFCSLPVRQQWTAVAV